MLTTIGRQKSSGSSRTVKTKRCAAIDCNNKKVSLDEARGIDKEGVYLVFSSLCSEYRLHR